MAITFHCEHCGKEIKTKEENGGKRAKCPYCKNTIYVPKPVSEKEVEELKLEPVDEEEEKRKRELLNQTYRIQEDILSQKEVPAKGAETGGEEERNIGEPELKSLIINFIRQSANGNMHDAEATVKKMRPHSRQALDLLDDMATSDVLEGELDDIPPGVLSGYIRNLRSKLK